MTILVRNALATLILNLLAVTAYADVSPCEKPIVPNKLASDVIIKSFKKRLMTYEKCIDAYITEQKTIAQKPGDPKVQQQAYAAAEAAIKERNDLVDTLNAQAQEAD